MSSCFHVQAGSRKTDYLAFKRFSYTLTYWLKENPAKPGKGLPARQAIYPQSCRVYEAIAPGIFDLADLGDY